MLRPRLAGVLGWPLTTTLSPAIQQAAFEALGIPCAYLPLRVEPEVLGDAIVGLKALDALGVNVTMPHKETVIAHLDEITGDAQLTGAVNTIEFRPGEAIGHNTDVEGFRELLENDAGVDVHGRSALVLGAGGASRAVVHVLSALGAVEIKIAARNTERAERVALLAEGVQVLDWPQAEAASSVSDVIVNCTPLGMAGEDPLPGAAFGPGQIVFDLIYSPPRTPLLDKARSAGAEAWGGLGMLVNQAAGSFRIWTGQEAPPEVMSAAALHAIGGGRTGG